MLAKPKENLETCEVDSDDGDEFCLPDFGDDLMLPATLKTNQYVYTFNKNYLKEL